MRYTFENLRLVQGDSTGGDVLVDINTFFSRDAPAGTILLLRGAELRSPKISGVPEHQRRWTDADKGTVLLHSGGIVRVQFSGDRKAVRYLVGTGTGVAVLDRAPEGVDVRALREAYELPGSDPFRSPDLRPVTMLPPERPAPANPHFTGEMLHGPAVLWGIGERGTMGATRVDVIHPTWDGCPEGAGSLLEHIRGSTHNWFEILTLAQWHDHRCAGGMKTYPEDRPDINEFGKSGLRRWDTVETPTVNACVTRKCTVWAHPARLAGSYNGRDLVEPVTVVERPEWATLREAMEYLTERLLRLASRRFGGVNVLGGPAELARLRAMVGWTEREFQHNDAVDICRELGW